MRIDFLPAHYYDLDPISCNNPYISLLRCTFPLLVQGYITSLDYINLFLNKKWPSYCSLSSPGISTEHLTGFAAGREEWRTFQCTTTSIAIGEAIVLHACTDKNKQTIKQTKQSQEPFRLVIHGSL